MPVSAETSRHISRFLIVGGTSVAIDLGVYATGLTLGLPREIAKGLGYLAGMIFGFILNKTWTFGSRQGATREAVIYCGLYATTFLVNIGVNAAVVQMIQDHFGRRPALAGAFLLATGLTTVLNYLGMRFITFRQGIADRRSAGP